MTAAQDSSLVKCSNCQALLSPELFNIGDLMVCPSCQTLLQVDVFPAILAGPAAVNFPEPILVEGESSCFYHPAKKAAVVCESCGRFLCALCDLDLGGKHVCPACLESGQKKAKFKDLENSRVLYDRMALSVAILPMIFLWPSIVGAPSALYLVLRYRKAPCSITGKSKIDFVIAAILAVAQISVWLLVFLKFFVFRHR